MMSQQKKKKKNSQTTARLKFQIGQPAEKNTQQQEKETQNPPGWFFPLYTQEAKHAAIREIRGGNLAHFLFVKQWHQSRFEEINDF